MKQVLALVLCVSVVMGQSVLEKWEKLHDVCQSDPATFVDESIFEKVKNNETVELPPNFGAHVFCMTVNLNIQDPNGKFNKEVTAKLIGEVVKDQAKVNKIVNECAVNKPNKDDAAVAFLQCLDKNNVDIGQRETY
ncbi:uncharacterized protein LOC143200561 [Rhynchophorus ferrugineus]|uniref:Uncharacterized protein n=1 Tax=Rhynchophorus ferrugineus TaxID=354439 RepID=A0A834I0N2_RHYFE|nr:hypothetical protein GWI33_014814 [Rhynchophorus ferrugineus]